MASDEFLKFLGTAGARFVMIKQLRASGGLWIRAKGTNVLVDPGPGSLIRCLSSRPKMDPSGLDAIILTHRHLDHSNDVNVMIEAMTEGGFKKRGILFLPQDALGENALVLKHVIDFVGRVEVLKENSGYKVGDFSFITGPQNKHPVQTYGLKFDIAGKSVSLVWDTAFYPQILDSYLSDILILNTVFFKPHPGIEHLNFQDAEYIISKLCPKKTILTHFGMTMLKAKPHIQAQELSQKLGLEVVAAYDGMKV